MTQKKDRIFSFENLNIQTGISLGASPEKTQPINIAFSWTTFLTIFSSCIKFAAQKWQQYVTHRSKSNRLELRQTEKQSNQSVRVLISMWLSMANNLEEVDKERRANVLLTFFRAVGWPGAIMELPAVLNKEEKLYLAPLNYRSTGKTKKRVS